VLRPETLALPAAETEEERAERWRKFWAEPPPPGWEDFDITPQEIKQLREKFYSWDGEPELDQ
jgi:hypothetical protein